MEMVARVRAFPADKIAAVERRLKLSAHPKQLAFIEDSHEHVNALVGRGGGKTTGGMFRFVLRMVRTPRARCLYIALTRDSARELMWDPLINLLHELDIPHRTHDTRMTVTLLANGAKLRLVGCDKPRDLEKQRGQPFHEVGIDETASIEPTLLANLIERIIGPRLGDYHGVMWMVGTPGHILKGEFFDGTKPGGTLHRPWDERHLPREGGWIWSSHAWTLLDGVAAGIERLINLWGRALKDKADRQWGDDHPIWQREYLGRWSPDDSESVFRYASARNLWEPEMVGTAVGRFAKLPADREWSYVIGMDMGHSDPFAIIVLAFSPSDPTRTIYQVFEFEQTKMYIEQLAKMLLGEDLSHEQPAGIIGQIGWPDAMICDMAHLGGNILDELRKVYGITIKMAEKGLKHKLPAIELVNGDLLEGRIKILRGKLEDELLALKWVTDEFNRVAENRTQKNDLSDAFLYARLCIGASFESNGAPPAAAPPPVNRFTQEPEVVEPKQDYGLTPATFDDEEW